MATAPFNFGEDDMKLMTAAIAILLSVSPAMAIDFDKPLTNLDGSQITGNDGKPLEKQPTLGSICESALLAQFPDERDQTGKELITPEEKFSRWKLAGKVHGNNVTLSAEDLATIKKLVGKAYTPLIVGQAWTMLDPGAK